MTLVQDDKQIQIVPVAIFFILFGDYMNMLSSKVKILFLIKWSDRSSQLCWLMRLEWLTNFEHVVQSLLNTFLFGVRF